MESRIARLEADFQLSLGRMDAIQTILLTVLRELPLDVSARCAASLVRASDNLTADMIAAPIHDLRIEAAQQALSVAHSVLAAAQQSR